MNKFINRLIPECFRHKQSEDVSQVKSQAATLIGTMQSSFQENARQKQMLEIMAHNIDGLVWIKQWVESEQTYLYEFANKPHCRTFFGIPEEQLDECVKQIQGKDDLELLNDFRERTGLRHTYGDLCLSTDAHAMEQTVLYHTSGGTLGSPTCTYLECGYVGDREVILEVTKTSLFAFSKPASRASHTYSIGNALDVSESCDSKLAYAQTLVQKGEAERLQNGVYWLFPKKDTCILLESEMQREGEV